jgi:hypothetical protein
MILPGIRRKLALKCQCAFALKADISCSPKRFLWAVFG